MFSEHSSDVGRRGQCADNRHLALRADHGTESHRWRGRGSLTCFPPLSLLSLSTFSTFTQRYSLWIYGWLIPDFHPGFKTNVSNCFTKKKINQSMMSALVSTYLICAAVFLFLLQIQRFPRVQLLCYNGNCKKRNINKTELS